MSTTAKTQRRYWLAGNREPGQDVFFVEALDSTLWTAGDVQNWDSCWYTGMPDPHVFEQLNETKSINHIPGNNGLTIKDYLYETLQAARARQASAVNRARMDYFPRVYAMPDDYHALQACAAQNPEKAWILKPKNSSRGRGIEVVQDIANIPLEPRWMVQEYIDNPHVMNDRKYVLRLYVLVSSVEPLRIYLHEEGFAKLASEPYNIEDPNNPFAHLTNPDINATNTDADAPVVFVALSEYRQWLRDEGHDDAALFAKIHDLVTLTVMAVRERMRNRLKVQKAPANGCYELLGVDCLVDADLKPWILECNLSPSLEVCAAPDDGGDTETKIKRTMVADMVSLLGLNGPPAEHSGLGREARLIKEGEGELARAGGFQCLFPAKESVEDYLSFFPVPRYADIVSAQAVLGHNLRPVRLCPNQTVEIVSEDELALYFEKNGTLYTPNPVSGWIWLQVADGADPEGIAQDLIAAHEAAHGAPSDDEQWMIRENVWDALASWAQLGLLRRDTGEQDAPEPASETPSKAPAAVTLYVGARAIAMDYGSAAVAARLGPLFAPFATTKKRSDLSIAIQRAPVGYALAVGSNLASTGLGLDNLAQIVTRALFEQAVGKAQNLAVAGTLVPISATEAVFFVAGRENGWDDALPMMLSVITGHDYAGGVVLDTGKPKSALPLGLPVRLQSDDVDGVTAKLGTLPPSCYQNWSSGGEGRLVASNLQGLYKPLKLRAIIVAARAQNSETEVKPASVHQALDALLVSATSDQGRSLSGAQVSALNDWLEAGDLYTLNYEDPKKAVGALTKALDL
ncbi:MAG: amylase [Robiginitomaculum sp.]|nr:MAG: amylase [Robiginitomaculum sp.]